jgi:hypothetical protein
MMIKAQKANMVFMSSLMFHTFSLKLSYSFQVQEILDSLHLDDINGVDENGFFFFANYGGE